MSDIQFQCAAQVTPDALVINWQLRNDGVVDYGVFSKIRQLLPDGTYSFPTHIAWIEVSDDGLLRISKSALPVPEQINLSAYVPPYCAKLPAGGTLAERVVLARPLLEMQPMKRMVVQSRPPAGQVTADIPIEIRQATFGIGIFPMAEPCRLVAEHPAFPDALTVLPPGSALREQRLVEHRFSLPPGFTVLRYRSAAWP